MVAPKIELPDLMAYGVSLKQLEQTDQRLAIDREKTTADILKGLDERQWLKMQTLLGRKGLPMSEIGGEASNILRDIINKIKEDVRKPKLPPAEQKNQFRSLTDDAAKKYFERMP